MMWPEDQRLDMTSDLASIRRLLGQAVDVDTRTVLKLMADAASESEKPLPNRVVIGHAVDSAVEMVKTAPNFPDLVDRLEATLERALDWLGPDWAHVLNLLRSEELGQRFPIEVVPYDPRWPKLYIEEATFLRSQFERSVLVRTEHFGSTAVVGLAAKPVIDILLELVCFESAKRVIQPAMEALGYPYFWRSDNPPGHMMFVKGYDHLGAQKFHLHMAPAEHPLWERLLFRDFLREHPDTAQEYETLKNGLAERFPHDREAYTRGKADFVNSVTGMAKRLYEK